MRSERLRTVLERTSGCGGLFGEDAMSELYPLEVLSSQSGFAFFAGGVWRVVSSMGGCTVRLCPGGMISISESVSESLSNEAADDVRLERRLLGWREVLSEDQD